MNFTSLRKTLLLLTLMLAVSSGVILVQANQAQALTVADQNGIRSACPHNPPKNTGNCSTFINSITVNGFVDNDTRASVRLKPIPYGYIIPGKTIKIEWTKTGVDPYYYEVRFGCGNSVGLANDNHRIAITRSYSSSYYDSTYWNVPTWVSEYNYCKIWVYAKANNPLNDNIDHPTLGVSNTRAFTTKKPAPAPLQASCSVTPNPAQVNQTVTFQSVNVSGGSGSYTYQWSGAVSGNSTSVQKTFSSGGNYTTYLTVKDANDTSNFKTTSCTVNVESAPAPLQASCSATPNPAQVNQTVTFQSSVSGGSGSYTYQWSGAVSGYNSSVQKTFSSGGNYTASLMVKDTNDTSTFKTTNCSVYVKESPAPTVNLTAYPSSINQGDSSTLSWTSSNATYCEASANPSTYQWSGRKNTTGPQTITPSQTTTYTITCYDNEGKASNPSQVTVTVNQPTPIQVSCSATPNPAQVNQTVTFQSSVSGGSGSYTYQWSGAVSGYGASVQRSFSSGGNYTAYLTVYDAQNQSISKSTSCSVYIEHQSLPAPNITFWADKYTLGKGESTHLRWTSSHANYCVASNGWSGTKSTYDYERTSPSQTTTYTLTCYGNGKHSTKSLTIYVISSGKNLSLLQLGRNLSDGSRVYGKVIRVTKGDIIEFYLTVTAGQNKDLSNAIVKDLLPTPLKYIAGTTKIDGVIQPDTITASGLRVGTIPRGTSKTVTFHAFSGAPGTYLSYTNTATATADNENPVQDTTSIAYGLVAGAATVRTGAGDSFLVTLLISLALTVFTWYYLKINPQGQLAFANLESRIREWKLNAIRRRIISSAEE